MDKEKETQKDLISVIVPVYNGETYLSACVDSILRQTYENLEMILVDDGSTDATGSICDSYAHRDKRVRVIHQENKGLQGARGTGIEAARGKYLGFVDGDDWIEPGMYASLYGRMGEADIVTSGLWKYDQYGNADQVTDLIDPGIYDGQEESFISNLIICANYNGMGMFGAVMNNLVCKLFKTEMVRKCFKAADVGVSYGEDLLFNIVYLLHCKRIVVTHDCYYHYRFNENSMTNVKSSNYLTDQNKIYHVLEQAVSGHKMEKCLRDQIERMLMFYVCSYTSSVMRLSAKACFPKFRYGRTHVLSGKRVVLFGAGKVGQSYYFDWILNPDIHIVLWVDNKEPADETVREKVKKPAEIVSAAFDYVVCAIQNKNQYEKIRQQLVTLGVQGEQILWEQPVNIFEAYFLKKR